LPNPRQHLGPQERSQPGVMCWMPVHRRKTPRFWPVHARAPKRPRPCTRSTVNDKARPTPRPADSQCRWRDFSYGFEIPTTLSFRERFRTVRGVTDAPREYRLRLRKGWWIDESYVRNQPIPPIPAPWDPKVLERELLPLPTSGPLHPGGAPSLPRCGLDPDAHRSFDYDWGSAGQTGFRFRPCPETWPIPRMHHRLQNHLTSGKPSSQCFSMPLLRRPN